MSDVRKNITKYETYQKVLQENHLKLHQTQVFSISTTLQKYSENFFRRSFPNFV